MKYLIFLIILIFAGCSGNILSDVASKTSDNDLLFEANQAINALDFAKAITIITTKMTASAQSSVAAKEVLTSAYGGQCGLIFVNYVTALSANTTSTSAMAIMKTPFVGTVVDPTACRSALDVLSSIGTFTTRTINQNTLAAILGMVLMGTSLRGYVDTSPIVGDGVNDVNVCTTMTDPQVDNVIIGFGYMIENFSALSAQTLGSTSMASLTTINNSCQSVGGSSCQITNPALITAPMRIFFRAMMNTSDYGIGTRSVGGNSALILGACP